MEGTHLVQKQHGVRMICGQLMKEGPIRKKTLAARSRGGDQASQSRQLGLRQQAGLEPASGCLAAESDLFIKNGVQGLASCPGEGPMDGW